MKSKTICVLVLGGLVLGAIGIPVLCVRYAHSREEAMAPKGEYAEIDVAPINKAMQAFKTGTDRQKQMMARQIIAAPEKYAPVAFFALSESLFKDGKKDDALFWFYAGDLRARFDAARCADETARQGVDLLQVQYAPMINQYVAQDFAKVEAVLAKVVEWDRKTPHEYDHRWINLHGMGAVMASMNLPAASQQSAPLSLPQDQWESIAEKTRTEYLAGFHAAVDQIRKAAAKEKETAKPARSS
jgi:hypothetical protein